MSNTPETDLAEVIHSPFSEVFRTMANERDEAVEELNDIRLNLGADAEGYTLIHAVCVLQQERDSLQIALEEISNLAKTLKTERDEAREELNKRLNNE
jgi:uncharacterized protein YbjQ (UPF0145 family)